MHGICFENPLQEWFDFKIPKTTIHPDYIHDCLLEEDNFSTKPNAKIHLGRSETFGRVFHEVKKRKFLGNGNTYLP